MSGNESTAGLVVLLSEKYSIVRKRCEKLWSQQGLEKISASEWYILSRINRHDLSVSAIAKLANITRQAAHKFIKGLEDKGLLQVSRSPKNKRDRMVQFTALGEQCVEICMMTERLLEEEISASIGTESVGFLKNILNQNWFLS